MEDRSQTLKYGVSRREVFAWAMYDFANSGYTTVIITAVYAAYFVAGIAGGAPWATFAWTLALSISYAIVMLTMPSIGTMADIRANKKRMLALFTSCCVLATLGLTIPQTGQVVFASIILIISNVFYSYGETINAAFLPELATEEGMGRVSGWGWSFGYIGGMLCLGICLAYVLYAKAQGDPATSFVPVTIYITAAMYGGASLFTFAWLKERAKPQSPDAQHPEGLREALQRLAQTFKESRKYKDFFHLLNCTVAYQAGVAVAISLSAVYAEQAMGFAQEETMLLIFALNIAAAAGAFSLGYVQDRIGHKSTLALTLLGWIVTCLWAAASTSKPMFWGAATLAGLCLGSSQSIGRALVGLFAPAKQNAEFFALWSFAVRLASIVGPLCYGAITWATGGGHRLAIVATTVFFFIGLWVLRQIDVARGIAAAQAANESVRHSASV